MDKGLGHFSKDSIEIAHKHMNGKQVHKELLNILIIRGRQIKTTMRCHLRPIRITTIKKKKHKITSVGKDVEKLETCANLVRL